MRFTRAALRLRLQKVRQTSHLKNLYNYLIAQKTKVVAVSSSIFFLYCLNKFYFRKYKGLNKLWQRFAVKDSPDPLILKADINYFNIFFSNNNHPWAIVFPKTLEETQKTIKYAIKYGLNVACANVEHLESSYISSINPYILINQKNLNSFHLDEEGQTMTIGTGLTVKEINEKLMEKGFYLPIVDSQKNLRFFELINNDNADLVHHSHHSISDLINSMNVVLPNGEALSTNIPIKKLGAGNSLNDLFVGTNSTLGIPVEATVKILSLPKKVYSVKIKGNMYSFNSKIFDLINDFKSVVNENREKLNRGMFRFDNENIFIELSAFSKIHFDKFFFKYLSEFEIQEEKFESNGENKKEIGRLATAHYRNKYEEIFRYNFEEQEFMDLLINSKEKYLKEFSEINKTASFSFSFNCVKNSLSLEILKKNDEKFWANEKFEELNKSILNYIINRNGLLVNYYDQRKFSEFKSSSRLIEFGKNNLHMQHFLKKMLDPKNIFINDNYTHEILE